MAVTYDLVLKGGCVVNHDGTGVRDVAVKDGRIAAIGEVPASGAGRVLEVAGLHVLPGVIDTHVHFREPGGEHKEDMASGSRAAVAGGVTAVFEMPNADPATVGEAQIADKLARAKGRMHCDYAFYVGATPENLEELGALERLAGVAAVKVYMGSSTGDLLIEDDALLERVLANTRRRAAFHAEDEPRLRARAHLRRAGDPASHSEWRDAEAALLATRRLVRLAERAGRRIHVLHVSTGQEMEFLAGHRQVASVEVTPQHLTLAAPEAYAELGARAQMNPPLRDRATQQALWDALAAGIVDTVGSDHAPHTIEEKARDYPASPSGMPGVETLVPIMLDHVHAGRLSLARFVDLTSAGPARLFQIAGKGRIAVGYDADLTVVDLGRTRRIEADRLSSRAGWSPFEGRRVIGWPVGTVVRGRLAMWEGDIAPEPFGGPVRFLETLGAVP